MKAKIKSRRIPPKLLAELARAVSQAAKGVRNHRLEAKACRDMDRMREELRKKRGDLDVAVDLIREVRDEA